MDLQLNTRTPNDTTVIIEVGGELESATCDDLREAILHEVAMNRSHIIVDLREVTFIDSTGLGVLVGGLKKMREHQGKFSLVSTQPRITRILQISGLMKFFPIYSTPEEAAAEEVAPAAEGEEASP